jgi:hypothetical protein
MDSASRDRRRRVGLPSASVATSPILRGKRGNGHGEPKQRARLLASPGERGSQLVRGAAESVGAPAWRRVGPLLIAPQELGDGLERNVGIRQGGRESPAIPRPASIDPSDARIEHWLAPSQSGDGDRGVAGARVVPRLESLQVGAGVKPLFAAWARDALYEPAAHVSVECREPNPEQGDGLSRRQVRRRRLRRETACGIV